MNNVRRKSDFFPILNVCSHCLAAKRDSLLYRYTESFPVIARSDGKTFHLILADVPRAYPAEKEFESDGRLSLGFQYAHITLGDQILVSIVILPKDRPYSLYRTIERVADSLSEELLNRGSLCPVYEIAGWRSADIVESNRIGFAVADTTLE